MRLTRHSILAVLAALTLFAPDALATTRWNERTALAAFLSTNPELAAARQGVGVARAEVTAAETWANPVIDTSREQIFSTGGPTEQNRIGLAVPISLPGKRGLRRAIALEGVEAAEARARSRQTELAFEFRRTYGRAYFADGRANAVEGGLAAYRRLERTVKTRQKAGESAGYDALRLGLQLAAVEARLAEIRAEAAHERGRLAGLLGRAVEGPLALASLEAVPEPDRLIETAFAHRPELIQLRAERRLAERSLELADRLAWPDPQLAVGLRQTNEPTVQGLGYTAGLNWPLPLFDRAQAARERARAEAERLEAETRALEGRLRGEISAARRALAERRATLVRFQAAVLLQAPRVVRVAELAYQEGEQGIVPLLDAHEAAMQARLQHLELAEAAHTAMLDLEALVGRPLPESLGDL